jgi:hypothetical protein
MLDICVCRPIIEGLRERDPRLLRALSLRGHPCLRSSELICSGGIALDTSVGLGGTLSCLLSLALRNGGLSRTGQELRAMEMPRNNLLELDAFS